MAAAAHWTVTVQNETGVTCLVSLNSHIHRIVHVGRVLQLTPDGERLLFKAEPRDARVPCTVTHDFDPLPHSVPVKHYAVHSMAVMHTQQRVLDITLFPFDADGKVDAAASAKDARRVARAPPPPPGPAEREEEEPLGLRVRVPLMQDSDDEDAPGEGDLLLGGATSPTPEAVSRAHDFVMNALIIVTFAVIAVMSVYIVFFANLSVDVSFAIRLDRA